MSNFKVIARASEKLQELLAYACADEPEIKRMLGVGADLDRDRAADAIKKLIVFLNPTETAKDPARKLSLWLYQITENEFVKNQPLIRTQGNGSNGQAQVQFPPLALNLFYLVTPFASSNTDNGESDHLLIGKTMQAFYDNASTLLTGDPDDEEVSSEELHLIFRRISLEELTRVWEALQEPYRLSVCYEVRVTRIDSQRDRRYGRVVERVANPEQ